MYWIGYQRWLGRVHHRKHAREQRTSGRDGHSYGHRYRNGHRRPDRDGHRRPDRDGHRRPDRDRHVDRRQGFRLPPRPRADSGSERDLSQLDLNKSAEAANTRPRSILGSAYEERRCPPLLTPSEQSVKSQ